MSAAKAITVKCPFTVPPFDAGMLKPKPSYIWWSWHPCYPYWSRSCWGGTTEAEAWKALEKPMAGSMKYYHNKLIREYEGAFTEVADVPCKEMDVWSKIAEQMKGGKLV